MHKRYVYMHECTHMATYTRTQQTSHTLVVLLVKCVCVCMYVCVLGGMLQSHIRQRMWGPFSVVGELSLGCCKEVRGLFVVLCIIRFSNISITIIWVCLFCPYKTYAVLIIIHTLNSISQLYRPLHTHAHTHTHARQWQKTPPHFRFIRWLAFPLWFVSRSLSFHRSIHK